MGLSAALAVAGQSLELFSAGVQVAGHNISNASTPGYIREKLLIQTASPTQIGNLVFGTGAIATGLRQQIDTFLEARIHAANTDFQSARSRELIFRSLEREIGELGDADLSSRLNEFLGAIHNVVNQPESAPLRQLVVQQGQQLAADVAYLRARVDSLREAQSNKVDVLVDEANRLITAIADLNPRIRDLEAASMFQTDAGALRTQRYEALNRLSEIVPLRFIERPDGTVDVYTGGDYLILGGSTQKLETVPGVDRGVRAQTVQLSHTGAPLAPAAGELGGVLQGRDRILGDFVDQLDALAANLIFEFNRIHASGEGLKGFSTVTSQAGVDDPAVPLNAAGLPFMPQHGSFQLKVTNTATGLTETATIAIDLDGIGGETSLADLQAALDAVGNVTATITPLGRLRIDAGAGYELRFADDTSGILAVLGINTFFTGSHSGNIGVNAAVANDQGLFAASLGGGPSDGRNVERLARVLDHPVAGLGGASLDRYYNNMIATVAQGSASETALAQGFAGFRDSLFNQREQFSGVSLDEEVIRVMELQRAFQTAARLISTIDELFETLLRL